MIVEKIAVSAQLRLDENFIWHSILDTATHQTPSSS